MQKHARSKCVFALTSVAGFRIQSESPVKVKFLNMSFLMWIILFFLTLCFLCLLVYFLVVRAFYWGNKNEPPKKK